MANKYPEHEFSNTMVPSDENGVPYPAHVAAEDTTLESSLETDIDDPSEDEDEDDEDDTDADVDVDDFGYVHNPDSDDHMFCFTTMRALREAGVRFDRTTWARISEGSLEFSIKLAED